VEAEPTRAFYRYKLASVLAAGGRLTHAVEEMRAAVALGPGEAFYRFRLGDFYLRLGWLEQASEEMRSASRMAPWDSYYLIRYGVVCLALGHFVQAIDAFRSALEIEPDNRCYRVLLADAHAQGGLQQEADRLFRQVGELNSYELEFVGRRRMESHCTTDVSDVR
jgi:tetratricopeptide (TPR) repeat protein